MKYRALSVLLLTCICITLTGCGRIWSYDFTKRSPIEGWIVTGDYDYDSQGLFLEGGFVSSKVAFGGDFTATVIFDLEVDSLNKANFAIWISDGHTISPHNYITNFGRGLGDPVNEEYGVRDYNYLESEERFIINLDAPFPGLDRDGLNTWKLYKEGSHITIVMNGTTTVSEFDIEHYQSTYAYLNIFGETGGTGLLLFKSVKVVYYDYMLGP